MEVHKGVPMPPAGFKAPRTEHGQKVRALAVGEVLFDVSEEVITRARYLAVHYGIKVSIRKCVIDGKRGWGMWRME